MAFGRVVLVRKPTPLDLLVQRYGSQGQVKFVLERSGSNFDACLAYHDRYYRSLEIARVGIPPKVMVSEIPSSLLPTYQFHPGALVATIGPDGLVVNTAKYLSGQPIMAINPDRSTIDGVLAASLPGHLGLVLSGAASGIRKQLSMAEATLDDGQLLLGVNDLFIGCSSHASARYEIEHGGRSEKQSSSGIIVSTGAGSTGWRRSVLAGAAGILEAQGLAELAESVRSAYAFGADERRLVFTVREPFASKATGDSLVCGEIAGEDSLTVTSEMPEGGVIFSDGVESDFLVFNSGRTATVRVADRQVTLIQAAWRAQT